MTTRPPSRRAFITSLAVAAIAALPTRRVRADELPTLSPKEPAAAALGYVENATQVDSENTPSYVKGSKCENCLQLQGKSGETYRPCNIFPGRLVAAAGWCSSWTAEM